ncbi:MAG: hypothetical protein CHACPFDD_02914 [Phycisphaerae bacterium]|nr:hypothetical protein [Phycisphaerae bacterium]
MRGDTNIGGDQSEFPLTQPSAVQEAGSADPAVRQRGLDQIVASYWKPIYKYIRLKWNADNEDAKDLTQAFFSDCIERSLIERYDAGRAAFRTYLRMCVDGFVSNQRKAAGRLKRGGDRRFVSLDFERADEEYKRHAAESAAGGGASPEEYFHREWLRGLFARCVEELRAACERSGRSVHFRLFERYDLDAAVRQQTSYAALAQEFDLPVTQVNNFLSLMRREFRRIVLAALRATTGNAAEFEAEVRSLLGTGAE